MDITTEKFYELVDQLIERLKSQGQMDTASKLYDAKNYQFNPTEILGELFNVISSADLENSSDHVIRQKAREIKKQIETNLDIK